MWSAGGAVKKKLWSETWREVVIIPSYLSVGHVFSLAAETADQPCDQSWEKRVSYVRQYNNLLKLENFFYKFPPVFTETNNFIRVF